MRTAETQKANQVWWEQNPMTYDWHGTLSYAPGTCEWFEEVDRRFLVSAYYAHDKDHQSFSRFLKRDLLDGKDVLEIGCGMGTHAAMLASSGARLTAVDLTERAVMVTKQRFEMFQLPGHIQQADCEQLPFRDGSFDFVWSWGVIHHSSVTERCLAEITRVLRPGGRIMLMVYYKPSIVYYIHCGLLRGIFCGRLFHQRLNEIYRNSTDGFYARVFTKKHLRWLLEPYYHEVAFSIVGLKAELVPIPRCRIKEAIEAIIPDWLASSILRHWGSMVVIEAVKKPD
jgi:ubiquinone/menaquinone biosynthesis C-methylase UbiE